jgi:hypothetical protein
MSRATGKRIGGICTTIAWVSGWFARSKGRGQKRSLAHQLRVTPPNKPAAGDRCPLAVLLKVNRHGWAAPLSGGVRPGWVESIMMLMQLFTNNNARQL